MHAADVFTYTDYRAYLRAVYAHKKQHEYGFSLRAFSRRTGLGSSNYLKLVMDGARNLSAPMARRFAKSCGLEGETLDYFCELVAYNQAATTETRRAPSPPPRLRPVPEDPHPGRRPDGVSRVMVHPRGP